MEEEMEYGQFGKTAGDGDSAKGCHECDGMKDGELGDIVCDREAVQKLYDKYVKDKADGLCGKAREEYAEIMDSGLYERLKYLGIVASDKVRSYNVGKSDYSGRVIQPWSVWLDWDLNPWDADIVKRIGRHKEGEDEMLKYEKIMHICEERIRQISLEKGEYRI